MNHPVHYITKFLDGLKPTVRVLVAIQQPATLDAAYTLALLYEELGDGMTSVTPSFFFWTVSSSFFSIR
jgi:hypothetical protein